MEVAFNWIVFWGGGLAVLLYVVWPLLALPAKVFSKGYFTFWVVISMIWGAYWNVRVQNPTHLPGSTLSLWEVFALISCALQGFLKELQCAALDA